MLFKYRTPFIGTLLFSLSALIACSAPGVGDPTSPLPAQDPTSTVAVETPESTVTPAPTETAQAPTPTATASESENPLLNSSWTLVSFGPVGEESPVLADSNLTLQFDDAGQAGGSGGCNSYGGEYQVDDGAITFGPIVSTMMACSDEDVMDQEQRYLAALQGANSFELSTGGQQLMISYDRGQGMLNYAQGAPPADQEDPSGSAQDVQVNRLAMFDGESGWATGRPGDTVSDQILITTDGGATWQIVTPQETAAALQQPSPDRTAAAYFASPQQAWVAFSRAQPAQEIEAPHVWLTADGGQTWQAGSPLDLGEMPFEYFGPSHLDSLDGQFGWMMTHLGAGMSHDYIAIFTTDDGGQTWRRVADPDSNPTIQACNKSGLTFTTIQEGWLAGNCPGLMQPLFLYHTTDGGASWSQTELPAPEQLGEGALGDRCGIPQINRLSGPGVALTLRCFDFEEESSQAWLYSSPDNGASWQAQPLPEAAGVFTFLDDTVGWYIAADESQPDADSRVYYTADGGASWSTLAQLEGQGQPQILFSDASNGWIVLGYPPDRNLLRTRDGGATWDEVESTIVTP